MARFGINDELDSRQFADATTTSFVEKAYDGVNKNNNSGRRKDRILTSRDNYYYFIERIYNYCNNQGIRPTNVIQWIQDLMDFSPFMYDNVSNNTAGLEENISQINELKSPNTNEKFFLNKTEDRRMRKKCKFLLFLR